MNDDDVRPNLSAHRRAWIQSLYDLSRAGVTHVPRPAAPSPATPAATRDVDSPVPPPHLRRTAAPTTEPPAAPAVRAAAGPVSLFDDESPIRWSDATAMPDSDRPAALEVIRGEVEKCTRCSALCSLRTQTVFGVGPVRPRLCMIGEAPGADEDREGIPFVGRAGQLLTKIIEACRLRREDVYIANILKCRPPDNRTPLPDEVAQCRGYLERQLAILRPEFICCLGATAAQALLRTTLWIGKLRGRFHDYQGVPVLCTYHPSYLLRMPAAKRDVWEDMKLLLRRMGVDLEATSPAGA